MGGETMNGVFTNTKKSIDFFLNCFSFLDNNEDHVKRFVEVEFKPNDSSMIINIRFKKYFLTTTVDYMATTPII